MTALDSAVDLLIAAIPTRDEVLYTAAFDNLARASRAADTDSVAAAVRRLAAVLAEAPIGTVANLPELVGTMAGRLRDTSSVLGVLVERACRAMEQAADFGLLYRETLGEPPSPTDIEAILGTFADFVPAARGRVDHPEELAKAWFLASDWAQPMLYLCQRADVRAKLPQRERLLAAAEKLVDEFGIAGWLHGILLVLDGAPLLVLHRPTGRGYRLTMSGIADNLQLHILLAARLIGDPDAGLLPGVALPPEMVAAADGTGTPLPAGGVAGRFNLVDSHGSLIPDEGRPRDILMVEGERVIVLDPPPFARRWNAARAYPRMLAVLRVDSQLTTEEAAAWLAKVHPPQPTSDEAPLSWTDDLSIPLPPGRTVPQLVDLVLDAALRAATAEEIERLLSAELGLAADDAAIARDRTFGGILRAGNPANRPDPVKDPIAWESYHRALADPSLVTRLYPQQRGQA